MLIRFWGWSVLTRPWYQRVCWACLISFCDKSAVFSTSLAGPQMVFFMFLYLFWLIFFFFNYLSECNCHEIGSRDRFCNDDQSGQCTCIENVSGRQCDMCRPGFWGFPQCRSCQCNGNADTCNPLTGKCENCRDNTDGDFCERWAWWLVTLTCSLSLSLTLSEFPFNFWG